MMNNLQSTRRSRIGPIALTVSGMLVVSLGTLCCTPSTESRVESIDVRMEFLWDPYSEDIEEWQGFQAAWDTD